MDLYYVFHITAIEKNFSKAGERLFITQPSVSHTIRRLETQLDVMLFNRTSKGVRLTKEGEVLLAHTTQIFELVNHAEAKINSMKKLEYGTLSIGGSDSTLKHYLMPYIQSFQALYPDIQIKIRHGSTPEIIEKLSNHTLDIGLVHQPIGKDDLKVYHFKNIESTFVTGDKYKYVGEHIRTLEEIKSYPFISFSKTSRTRNFLIELFIRERIDMEPDIEVGSVELLIESAKMGMGIALIAKEWVADYLETGLLHEIKIDTPIESREISVALKKDAPDSIIINQFLKHIGCK